MTNNKGEIIIRSGITIWPHELKTAQALANAGHRVIFLERIEAKHEQSADVLIDGIHWEIKSPKSDKLKRVERTLRDALHQSAYVIYDSQRVKLLHDDQIRHELEKWSKELRSLKGLMFVTKKRDVIVMK